MNWLGGSRGSSPVLGDDGSLSGGAWEGEEGEQGLSLASASCSAKISQGNYGCSSKEQKHFGLKCPFPSVPLLGNQSFSVLLFHYPVQFSVQQPLNFKRCHPTSPPHPGLQTLGFLQLCYSRVSSVLAYKPRKMVPEAAERSQLGLHPGSCLSQLRQALPRCECSTPEGRKHRFWGQRPSLALSSPVISPLSCL